MSNDREHRGKRSPNYEQRQVEKIASWKGSYPNPFAELFHEAARPLTRFIEFLVPDALALGAIEAAYKASELSATQADIKVQAGVRDIRELRHASLEICDRLSRRVGTMAQGARDRRGRPHRGRRRLDHAA